MVKKRLIKIEADDTDSEEEYEKYKESHKYVQGVVPEFIKDILENNFLSKRENDRFIEEFAYPYMCDSKYRENVHGKSLVIADKHFIGIFDKTQMRNEEFKINNLPKNKKYVYRVMYIGDDQRPIPRYYRSNVKIRSTIGNDGTEEPYQISHKLKLTFYLNSGEIDNNYTIDSGASTTSMPYSKYWNYSFEPPRYDQNLIFSDNGKTKQQQKDIWKVLEEINGKISHIDMISCIDSNNNSTPYNKVIFNPSITVGIKDMNPVNLKSLIIPRYKSQNKPATLMGLDMYRLHTLIYGNFEGSDGLIILPAEEFNSNEDFCKFLREHNTGF